MYINFILGLWKSNIAIHIFTIFSIGLIGGLLYIASKTKYISADYLISSLYKYISFYNLKPFHALYWLFGMIAFYGVLIFSISEHEFMASMEYSFLNAIPLLKNTDLCLSTILNWFGYFQLLFSSAVLLLFSLALKRKFQR